MDQLPKGEHLDLYRGMLEEVFSRRLRGRNVPSFQAGSCGGGDVEVLVLSRAVEFEGGGEFVLQHILPAFNQGFEGQDRNGGSEGGSAAEFERYLAPLWDRDLDKVIEKKLRDRKVYEGALRILFDSV